MKRYILVGILFAILCMSSSCGEEEPLPTLPTAHSQTTGIKTCADDHSFTEDSDYCSICGTNYYSVTLEMELSDTGDYYIVTGLGNCTRTVVRIPEVYNNLPVAVIDENAFNARKNPQCSQIVEIEMPSTVKEIRGASFRDCELLECINLSSNLISIGAAAFKGCESLREVTLPDSLQTIEISTFADCSNLQSISFPGGITTLPAALLMGCTSLKSIFVESATEIGHGFAEGCGSLESIVFGEQMSVIADRAFACCTMLKEIVLPNTLTQIGENAFTDCTSLISIHVPVGIKTIGKDAFSGCEKLQYNVYEGMAYLGNAENPYCALIDRYDTSCKVATVHDDTKMIADNAFAGSDIQTLIIGENLREFGEDVLLNLKSLLEVRVSLNNPKYHTIGNCLIETDSKTLLKGCSTSVIPDDGSVTSIGKMAFAYVAGMTSIVIPDTVVSIEANAFIYCVDLEEMIIGSGVQFVDHDQLIGAEKFSRCYYRGNQNQWDMIDIIGITSGGFMGLNTKIKNAIKYFYSETKPAEPGNYWRYVDGVPTPWEEEE